MLLMFEEGVEFPLEIGNIDTMQKRRIETVRGIIMNVKTRTMMIVTVMMAIMIQTRSQSWVSSLK